MYDHKNKKTLALKILKDSEELYDQFKLEIKIMKIVREHPSVNKNIIEIKGDFEFRGHVVFIYIFIVHRYGDVKFESLQLLKGTEL